MSKYQLIQKLFHQFVVRVTFCALVWLVAMISSRAAENGCGDVFVHVQLAQMCTLPSPLIALHPPLYQVLWPGPLRRGGSYCVRMHYFPRKTLLLGHAKLIFSFLSQPTYIKPPVYTFAIQILIG